MKTSTGLLLLDVGAKLLQENKKLKETIKFLEKLIDKERAVNRGVTHQWPDRRALTNQR